MRQLYPPLWEGLNVALRDIFEGGYPADKVIQRQLKAQRKWGSSDRRLFAEAVYDIVRWWRKLLFAIDVPWPEDDRWTNAEPKIMASVIEAWCLLNDVELGKSVVRLGLNKNKLVETWRDETLPRTVRQSIPDWLDAWAMEQLPDRWDELLTVLNQQAPVFLRANRLKTTPEKLIAQLKAEKISARLVEHDAIQLEKRTNVFLTKSFKAGQFEVQDHSSQRVARFLAPEPGERVIDACAGAGGKTLHLAALMGNKGRVLSLDVAEVKLEQLRERATRAGANCIEVKVIDSTKVIKRLADNADRLLLDVPCSGLGVLRRNPDSKWKLSLEEVKHVQGLQSEILNRYSSMCKVGGTMVYATCSMMPKENERQVESFLSQNEKSWQLESQLTCWPEVGGSDGFFMARLKRLS